MFPPVATPCLSKRDGSQGPPFLKGGPPSGPREGPACHRQPRVKEQWLEGWQEGNDSTGEFSSVTHSSGPGRCDIRET